MLTDRIMGFLPNSTTVDRYYIGGKYIELTFAEFSDWYDKKLIIEVDGEAIKPPPKIQEVVDFIIEHSKEADWPALSRCMKIFEEGFKKKIEE